MSEYVQEQEEPNNFRESPSYGTWTNSEKRFMGYKKKLIKTLCNLDFNMNQYGWKLELHDNVQFRKSTKLNFNKICKAINGTCAEVHSYTYLCELGFTIDQYDC
jgi:hypothetical protein